MPLRLRVIVRAPGSAVIPAIGAPGEDEQGEDHDCCDGPSHGPPPGSSATLRASWRIHQIRMPHELRGGPVGTIAAPRARPPEVDHAARGADRRLGDAHELGNLAGEKGTTSTRSISTGPAPPARVLVFTGVEGEHAAWVTRVPNPTRQ